MKKTIEIQIDESTASICRSLGISPVELFEKLQSDLIGNLKNGDVDDTMLLHLYIAQSIATSKQIDRSKIEDFLAHVISLKKQFDQHDYTFLMDEAFTNHQVICEYCQSNQLVKVK